MIRIEGEAALADHHLITQQIWKEFQIFFNDIGMSLNAPKNMLTMATASSDADVAVHSGRHLNSYVSPQRDALKAIADTADRSTPEGINAAVDRVNAFRNELR